MPLTEEQKARILELLRRSYPDWSGFSDPRFEKEEIAYKRAAIEKTRGLLSAEELRSLMERRDFDEFLKRLRQVAGYTNLLFLGVPKSGDLGILNQPSLDKPGFCAAVLDLLHGSGSGAGRLGRYLAYVTSHDLPNKWTFPTYFLFLCHPESEIFVKPAVTKAFLRLLGTENVLEVKPSADSYAAIKRIIGEVRDALGRHGPRDMVDMQSVVWVCGRETSGPSGVLSDARLAEFRGLYREFIGSYPASPEGQKHCRMYPEVAEQARRNLETIVASAERGDDVTDAVLLKLLPYADSAANREKGAWVSYAPAITGDVKGWFEAVGWVKSEEWPRVAEAILRFVRRCDNSPGELDAACREFSESPFSKGLQTGMLTPVLNALRPDDFLLVNNKSRRVLNYLTGSSYGQGLDQYPLTNEKGWALVEELADELPHPEIAEIPPASWFDMFCHWLVAAKKYPPRKVGTGRSRRGKTPRSGKSAAPVGSSRSGGTTWAMCRA